MRNDRVLNNWEYQKQVLYKFLTEHEIKCHEQAVSVAEESIDRLKRLEGTKGSDNVAHGLNGNKRLAGNINFIIELLRQRRSFVEGYLGS